MKRLLISSALLFSTAAALAAGGTGAFFSDTETSTGNTFTAGAIDLKIDNTSYYNGLLNQGTTWTLDDLNNGLVTLHKFFDFNDLKPGDIGEDTISLHVNTNDAYLCANVKLTSNDDNTPTEPELLVDQTTGAGLGELAQQVNFLWWADDGDNVLEVGENVISQGPIGNIGPVGNSVDVTLADSQTNIWTGVGGPIPGNATKYIGKGWCFGAITLQPESQDGPIVDTTPADGIPDNGPDIRNEGFICSGASLGNETQTDSLTADVSFEATQARNNPSFLCPTGHCPIGTVNILVPGYNFELPIVVNGALWDVFSSPTGGWNVEWRGDVPAIYDPDGPGGTPQQNRPDPAKLEYHRGVLGAASEGQQYVELDSDWGGPSDGGTGEPASVKIYQDITTVPGKQYEIHYAFAARPSTPAADNNLEFRWGGVVEDTTGPTAGAAGPIVWSQRVVAVTATTTTTRIEFTDLGTANSVGTFLDDIRVYTEECTP